MKVLLVSPLPPPAGGIARWTQMYLDGCHQAGLTVELINMRVSLATNRISRSSSWLNEIKRTWYIIWELSRKKNNFKPDIVHLCSSCSRWGGLWRDYLCSKIVGNTPLVFHCHCNIADQATTRISQWLFRNIVRKSKAVIVLNDSSEKWAQNKGAKNVVKIPNFIGESYIAKSRQVSEQVSHIAYVGHVLPSKGTEEIYQIATLYPEVKFQIIGFIQELPTSPKPANVMLSGEVSQEQVFEKLKQADIFFFPTHSEGFANVMLEAMAAGLPIIATDVGANRDMIEDKGGIIVPVGDCKAMAMAIEQLRPALVRQQMAEWNIQKVKNSYTVDKVMQTIKKCYEEIVL